MDFFYEQTHYSIAWRVLFAEKQICTCKFQIILSVRPIKPSLTSENGKLSFKKGRMMLQDEKQDIK